MIHFYNKPLNHSIRSGFICLMILSCIACKKTEVPKLEAPQELEGKDYTLKEEEGIFVEVFDSTNVDANRYTANNRIYQEDSQFTYRYEHITEKGQKQYFDTTGDNDDENGGWVFTGTEEVSENTVKEVVISVQYGLEPMIKYLPEYNQTILSYKYPFSNGESASYSISGAIENEKNVWIHPPRENYFRILELNPFPFIKAPYEVGNQWEWKLRIGSQWGDKRWKTWDGGISNKYLYEITGQKMMQTPLGKLECFVVEATATSKIGNTSLTSFFNPVYGFVRLDYINIDGSKTNLELVEFREGKTVNGD